MENEEEKKSECKICGRTVIVYTKICKECEKGLKHFANSVEYLQAAIYYLNPMEKIR